MTAATLHHEPAARPPLPPLSPLHAALFAACLDRNNPALKDLADAAGLSPAEVAAHLADPALQAWIDAAASLQAQRAAVLHADASLTAVLALTHICRTSDNAVDVRRAATTILQGARTLLSRRPDRSPDRPSPSPAPTHVPHPTDPIPPPSPAGPHGATPTRSSPIHSDGWVGGPPSPDAPQPAPHPGPDPLDAPESIAAAGPIPQRPLTRAERRRMNQRVRRNTTPIPRPPLSRAPP